MTEWRRSPVIAVVVVTLFLVIQLALPISLIGPADQGQRFGWQMFALVAEATEFTVHGPHSWRR